MSNLLRARTVLVAHTAARSATGFQSNMFLRSFSSRLDKATYAGPYSEVEVHDLEKFAMEVLRKHEPSRKLVEPWLRSKLGPFYKENWQQRVAAREEEAKKQERATKRPAESSHFTINHPVAGEDANASKDLFAVVGLAGTQFKVTTGDVVICNRLPQAEVGTKIELTDVLLVGSNSRTLVGRPSVPNWVVTAFVEQQAREKKQLAFYKKPKTYSQKTRGFRREVTILRIAEILNLSETSVTSSSSTPEKPVVASPGQNNKTSA